MSYDKNSQLKKKLLDKVNFNGKVDKTFQDA